MHVKETTKYDKPFLMYITVKILVTNCRNLVCQCCILILGMTFQWLQNDDEPKNGYHLFSIMYIETHSKNNWNIHLHHGHLSGHELQIAVF